MLKPRSHRILIVEDEKDWVTLMTRALENEIEDRGLSGLITIDAASNATKALHLIDISRYDLVSLDMRIPHGMGDSSIEVVEGESLAHAFSRRNIPAKYIIYSATLAQESIWAEPADGMRVAQIAHIDKYAKSSGGDVPPEQAVETLTTKEWAQRVLAYLDIDDERTLALQTPSGGTTESALGAWLSGAAQGLPPVLARHAQNLRNYWPEPGHNRVEAGAVDAALKFIEAGLRLAVAQTAVLLNHNKPGHFLTDKSNQKDFVDLLRNWIAGAGLAKWSWSHYLTKDVIDAFDEARKLRNEARHSLRPNCPKTEWNTLYPALRQVMDMAGYWAKHPLIAELRYKPGKGWAGELLCSTAYPRPTRPLSGKRFPDSAAQGGIWQLPIRTTDEPPGWEEVPLSWDSWLRPDKADARPLWLAIRKNRDGRLQAFDLADGELIGAFPA